MAGPDISTTSRGTVLSNSDIPGTLNSQPGHHILRLGITFFVSLDEFLKPTEEQEVGESPEFEGEFGDNVIVAAEKQGMTEKGGMTKVV